MLSAYDDYPIHQAAMPIFQTVTGDSNAYDRYFFHGYDADTGMIFVVALGVYPNRQIIDAAFCVSVDGHQRSVFASGRLDPERTCEIGPIRVDVVEPMRVLRVHVDAPEQGLAADLTFTARTAAIQEPQQVMMDRNRVTLDSCRFTQFGRWSGSLRTGDVDVAVTPDAFAGTRDRSWGVRPLSGATPLAPPTTGHSFWWMWAPLQFDDGCAHMAVAEDESGMRQLEASVLADLVGDGSTTDPSSIEHGTGVRWDVEWAPGVRRVRRAVLTLERLAGDPHVHELEPVGRIHMRGVGYTHLERGHGAWHGELSVAGEELVHDDVDPWDFTALHVQQVMRVTGTRTGVGVLEELHIGPHTPSGLTGIMDPPA